MHTVPIYHILLRVGILRGCQHRAHLVWLAEPPCSRGPPITAPAPYKYADMALFLCMGGDSAICTVTHGDLLAFQGGGLAG